MIGAIIFLFLFYNVAGGLIVAIIADYNAGDWEVMNPACVHKYTHSLNWFGATMVSLLCTILCPIVALCYWFYFLCTVGRK